MYPHLQSDDAGKVCDHCFSVRRSFELGPLPIELVCNPSNLRMLDAKANIRKGQGCSITIMQLKREAIITETMKAIAAALNKIEDAQTLIELAKALNEKQQD